MDQKRQRSIRVKTYGSRMNLSPEVRRGSNNNFKINPIMTDSNMFRSKRSSKGSSNKEKENIWSNPRISNTSNQISPIAMLMTQQWNISPTKKMGSYSPDRFTTAAGFVDAIQMRKTRDI